MNVLAATLACLLLAPFHLVWSGELHSTLMALGDKVVRVYEDGNYETVLASTAPNKRGYPDIYAPSISPNQELIAYLHAYNIWVYDVNKKTSRQITMIGKPYSKRFASIEVRLRKWSHDGAKILYDVWHGETDDPEGEQPSVDIRNADYGFHVVDLKTGRDHLDGFLNSQADIYGWLDNGDLLLEIPSDLGPMEKEVIRYNPESKKHTQLIGGINNEHRLRPDSVRNDLGKALATETFVHHIQGEQYFIQEHFVEFDLATGQQKDVTPLGEMNEYYYPSFSPSGHRIAYIRWKVLDTQNHSVQIELIVDNKSIYSITNKGEHVSFSWIDDAAILLQSSVMENLRLDDTFLIIDANTGRIRASRRLAGRSLS